MSESGIWKKISDFLFGASRIDSESLGDLLEEDDSVVLAVQTLSCRYKPRAWIDRNAFFRSTLILTQKRVLLLKSGSKTNLLRDIALDTITRHKFSSAKTKEGLRFEIRTIDSEDIITFHRQYTKEYEELRGKFEETLARASELSAAKGETFFCMHCGAKIPTVSVFCSSCGKKVKV